MNRAWGTGGHKPGLIVRMRKEDAKRLGYGMSDRIKWGQLAICRTHAGDCFWTYALVKKVGTKYYLIDGSNFGAYTFGEPYKFQPTEKEFHLLMGGMSVKLEAETK